MGSERRSFLNPKLEQILAATDDDLNPIQVVDPAATPAPGTVIAPTDEPVVEPDATTPVAPPETTETTTTTPNPETPEGLTANDLASDETAEDPTSPETPEPTPTPQNLDPETQYIVDNLPDITTTILVDGKAQEVSVKSWTQLPQNVEFATKRDELAFMNALTAQENRARELQTSFRSTQSQNQATEFEAKEAQGIRDDITALQQEKLIPNFQSKPDDPGFNDDPGTQQVQKVLDFMNKKNQEYLENSQKGSIYKHIGFQEAFYMMPETRQASAQQTAQRQEDTERHQVANNVSGNTGLTNLEIKKPTVPRGTTMQQIADYYENTL